LAYSIYNGMIKAVNYADDSDCNLKDDDYPDVSYLIPKLQDNKEHGLYIIKLNAINSYNYAGELTEENRKWFPFEIEESIELAHLYSKNEVIHIFKDVLIPFFINNKYVLFGGETWEFAKNKIKDVIGEDTPIDKEVLEELYNEAVETVRSHCYNDFVYNEASENLAYSLDIFAENEDGDIIRVTEFFTFDKFLQAVPSWMFED